MMELGVVRVVLRLPRVDQKEEREALRLWYQEIEAESRSDLAPLPNFDNSRRNGSRCTTSVAGAGRKLEPEAPNERFKLVQQ